MNVTEIKIPVPWGFLAAKAWGDEQDNPVIALHGLQDNANTFDTLIPLLPKTFYYICVDQPGHGKSSPFRTDSLPTYLDYILSIKLLLDYLNRKKYILMGHSLGGRNATFFAQMYPEYVTKLIMLDASYYIAIEPERCFGYYKEIFREYEKQLKNKSLHTAPKYTFEEAVNRMRESRFSELSEDSAKIMMQRSLVPAGDGKYMISTAQNLKYCGNVPLSQDYCVDLLKCHPIICPHLLLMAEDGENRWYERILNELQKNPKCEIYFIKGEHDVHMDNPERIAPIITKFLLEHNMNKL